MDTIIKDVKIPEGCYFVLNDDKKASEISRLRNLSKINIFIGENNSGKSRLLRTLISNELNFEPNNEEFSNINLGIPIFKKKIEIFFKFCDFEVNVISGLETLLDELNGSEFLLEDQDFMEILRNIERLLTGRFSDHGNAGYIRTGQGTSQTISIGDVARRLNDILYEAFNIKYEIKDSNLSYSFKRIYIPVLRGLRQLYCEEKDVYNSVTRNDYFNSTDKYSEMIFTGLDAYEIIRDHLLGNLQERKLIKEFEKYLSIQFFDNKSIAIIPQEKPKKVLKIKIGDEKEREIQNLGDGIQSIIIMTLPLFLKRQELGENENYLMFIEEPEHLLHPGLQRKLIDTFNDERFDKFQFFITTHSNHFLDIMLDYNDVSIFYLKKILDKRDDEEKTPSFFIEPLSYGDNNALELLGVRNTSVFLSNCTIWVEGVTDRYYIKKYFDTYQNYLKNKFENRNKEFKDFREDYHYSFVEYSGNNITHWSFLDEIVDSEDIVEEPKINVKRLCGKLFLIADSDNATTGKKAERHEKLNAELNNGFCLLNYKEIENLLSKKVLLEVLKEYEGNSDEFDYYEFEESAYENECLGKFIDETILKEKRKRRGSYQKKNNSGNCVTISDKVNFCKKALKHINNFDDLSEGSKGLCNSIYQFIAINNGYELGDYHEICTELNIPDRSVVCKTF